MSQRSGVASRRIRVTWVVLPLVARGGGFDILRGWIGHLPAERFDLTLVFYSAERQRIEAALAGSPHVRLIFMEALHTPSSLFFPAILALRRRFLDERPDIVHSVMVQGDILGAIAAWLAGVPVMMSTAIGYLIAHTSPWKARLYRLGLRAVRNRIRCTLAISAETKRELVQEFRFDERRVRVLYSGIEIGLASAARVRHDPAGLIIGTVGELIEEKGVQHLLRAAPAILARYPSARFRIVGDGDYRASLEALAFDLGIANRVEFMGWIQNGRDAIREFDVFVFASNPGYDGLPRVLLEAWAVGTPFVTTNVAVVPEIVTSEIDGIVVPPADAAAIADGVVRLLSDEDLWERIRTAGLRRVLSFSVEREVQSMQSVYHELAAEAGVV